jgi:hypothetical protein
MKLTWVVTRASLAAGFLYFALAIAAGKSLHGIHNRPWLSAAVVAVVLGVPLAAAAAWVFRALQRDYSRREAVAAAISYVVFAPFAVAVGLLVALVPGSYADLALGPPFGFIGSVTGFLFVMVALSVLICLLAVRFARKTSKRATGGGE